METSFESKDLSVSNTDENSNNDSDSIVIPNSIVEAEFPMENNSHHEVDDETKEYNYNEEELKQIAESLAPQVTSLLDTNQAALEEMLAQDEKDWYLQEHMFHMSHVVVDDDDDDDEEENDVGLDHLRKELEASHDFEFSSLSINPIHSYEEKEDIVIHISEHHDTNNHHNDQDSNDSEEEEENQNGGHLTSYTLYDHAKYLNLHFDDSDLGYPSCPLWTKSDASKCWDQLVSEDQQQQEQQNSIQNDYTNNTHRYNMTRKERKKMIHTILSCNQEYIKPMSSDALSRIYEGFDGGSNLSEEDIKRKRNRHRSDINSSVCIKDSNGKHVGGNYEILPIRTMTFQIRPDVLCGAVMDAVYSALNHLDAEVTKRQGGHLRALVPGTWIPEPSYNHFRPFGANQGHGISSPMLRPQLMTEGMVFLPSFVVDVQLCLKRSSRTMERVLLTRVFRISPGQSLDDGPICPDVPLVPSSGHGTESFSSHGDSVIETTKKNLNLREASSLFQRMKSVAQSGGRLGFDDDDFSDIPEFESDVFSTPNTKSTSTLRNVLTSPLRLFSPSKPKKVTQPKPVLNFVRFDAEESLIEGVHSARSLASEKLISFFIVTPSVYDDPCDIDPIPSLSFIDWPWVQSSWRFISSCLNELESRNLAYSTLISCPLGAFPSLPTLDVHYCSQIKAVSKQNMISSLLKSAQELEVFARESEYLCAKLIKTLEPTFLLYEEEPPQLPKAIPVSEYPLEFTPHEEISPPWGQKVIEALNLIAASVSCSDADVHGSRIVPENIEIAVNETIHLYSPEKKDAFDRAKSAVLLVLSAFQRQFDEELSARLGRKNLQVMDRIGKMQAYKRQSIMNIRAAYGINAIATEAADTFHELVMEYNASSEPSSAVSLQPSNRLPASEQVPLLTCRVLMNGSSGTCYITHQEILVTSQGLVGARQIYLTSLNLIFVRVQSTGKKSRLNPVPSIVEIIRKIDGEMLFSFRPSIGARALQDFIKTMTDIVNQKQGEIDFSKDGGLINMYDQRRHVKEAALGDPEVSGV